MKNKKLFYGILIVAVLVIAGIGLFVLHNSAFAQSPETMVVSNVDNTLIPTPKLTIATDKKVYTQEDEITIIIKNDSDRPIWYGKAHCGCSYSGCNLFKWENKDWKEVKSSIPCPDVTLLARGKPFHPADELKPGESINKYWAMMLDKPLEIGTYRFSFYYGLSQDNYTERTVYSNEFIIKKRGVTFKVWVPGIEPDGILPNVVTDVKFGVLVTGITTPVDTIRLEEVGQNGNSIKVVGYLRDAGRDGDLLPDDYIYSGIFPITSEKEGKLYYRATMEYGGQVYISETATITVTDFPIGPMPSNPNFLVKDPKTEQKFYSNELNVKFKDEISLERIKEIVSSEKTSVVGTIPGIGVFHLHISGDGTANAVYEAIKAFQSYKEVDYAEPNYAVELDNHEKR